MIRPTLDGMQKDGHPYLGFLYAGLMIMADGTPKVIEFNCRMGDPETQPIMMRLRSSLTDICSAALDGSLANISAEWDTRSALGVVLAAGGYPNKYEKGHPITGLENANSDTQKVFHAGTTNSGTVTFSNNDSLGTVTSGGRVLCVVGLGDSVAEAAATAYKSVDRIHWDGVYYRRDIGHRAITREKDAKKC